MLAQKLLTAGKAEEPVYIEDVFSTYLYTGNGSTQTITNGIDLSTKGGLVWIKSRSTIGQNSLYDTVRGATQELSSNSTNPQTTATTGLTAFNSSGFSLGSGTYVNTNTTTYSSWTFRKQPKFFDVVSFTSNGTSTQTINHSLASAPGCILLKRTDSGGTQSWMVWHRGNGTTSYYMWSLNNTTAATTSSTLGAYMTSTSFQPNRLADYLGNSPVNGGTYIAYLYAHDAGGFGLTGTDNVISCGSFTADGSGNATVSLGYEPQLIMYRRTGGASNWEIYDTMRGWNESGFARLYANTTDAESAYTTGPPGAPTSTGFTFTNGWLFASNTYIYIAIRRGPMKVPTSGTSVFSPQLIGAATGTNVTTGFPIDLQIYKNRDGGSNYTVDRLRGVSTSSTAINYPYLVTEATSAEASTSTRTLNWRNTGFQIPSAENSITNIFWNFRRAPSFFDEVCYTGTGANRTVTHNLGVAPELIIVKARSGGADAGDMDWVVYQASLGPTKYLILQTTNPASTAPEYWNGTSPTASVFSVGTQRATNQVSANFVAYLFATCAGVSKVGSYTGNGSSQTINCGFTGGARFVLIKRTDSTGDWYIWDTARGIVASNDSHLSLNTTAAEVTTDDTIDTNSTGFVVNQLAATNVNVTSATYIFLAIA